MRGRPQNDVLLEDHCISRLLLTLFAERNVLYLLLRVEAEGLPAGRLRAPRPRRRGRVVDVGLRRRARRGCLQGMKTWFQQRDTKSPSLFVMGPMTVCVHLLYQHLSTV